MRLRVIIEGLHRKKTPFGVKLGARALCADFGNQEFKIRAPQKRAGLSIYFLKGLCMLSVTSPTHNSFIHLPKAWKYDI